MGTDCKKVPGSLNVGSTDVEDRRTSNVLLQDFMQMSGIESVPLCYSAVLID